MTGYWIVLIVGWALLCFALRRLDRIHKKPLGLSHTDELHHGYIGGWVALGLLLGLMLPKAWSTVFLIAGLVLLVEDGVSHIIQGYRDKNWRGLFWQVYRWITLKFKKGKQ